MTAREGMIYLSIYTTYSFFIGFWVFSQFDLYTPDLKVLFSDLYGVVAFFSGLLGLFISKHWGGFKSYLGKALGFFSIGLLLQALGQFIYSYYALYLHIDVPYPSLGDLGFFGSIPAYILGAWSLSKVVGIKYALKKHSYRYLFLFIPLIVLIISYIIFLKGYEFDFSNPIGVLLDFGYPLGQSIYVSLALSILVIPGNYIGGILKSKVIFLLFALISQYLSDFVFLYQFVNETWEPGGINDFMYLISYLLMTISLMRFHLVFKYLSNTRGTE